MDSFGWVVVLGITVLVLLAVLGGMGLWAQARIWYWRRKAERDE